jgi:exodeoxyribonuclease V alpha subunit
MTTIEFKITKTTFTKQDFAIFKADTQELGNITIKGNLKYFSDGDVFKGELKKEKHPIYGIAYNLVGTPEKMKYALDDTIVKQLSKVVKGVGKKTFQAIYDRFGVDTMDIIESNPERLKECKVSQSKINLIHRSVTAYSRFKDLKELLEFLQIENLDSRLAIIIEEDLDGLTAKQIKANPFLLIKSDKIPFKHMEQLHEKMNGKTDDPARIGALIINFIRQNINGMGNMFCYKVDLLNYVGTYNSKAVTEATILESLERLEQEKEIAFDQNNAGMDCVYLTPMFHVEENIVKNLKELLSSFSLPLASPLAVSDFIDRFEQKGMTLASKQKEAVEMALTNRISVLTGGPGTGKTYTLKTITNAVKSLKSGVTIKLLAPTGKASKRMADVIGMEAETIHRGLGIKGFGETDAEVKLDVDLVIVDESSMIDASLFLKLLKSLGADTRLLLVGDSNQLDSVGAGRILKDIIESGVVATTELDEVFRQAKTSQIVTNAHSMITGIDFSNGLTANPKNGDFFFVERQDEERIQKDVLETVRRFVKKGFKLEDIMILSPMRKGEIGVYQLNSLIQKEFNPPNNFVDFQKKGGQILRVGDRVIHTENNRDLGVYNGEIGEIASIYTRVSEGEEKETIEVAFPDKEEPIIYVGTDIYQLDLAYAITIHKSQGSEAPIVIMPVSSSQQMMLSRSLIYTGVTRAKEVVVLIGEKEAVNKGLKVVSSDQRLSLIAEKLNK